MAPFFLRHPVVENGNNICMWTLLGLYLGRSPFCSLFHACAVAMTCMHAVVDLDDWTLYVSLTGVLALSSRFAAVRLATRDSHMP